MLRSCRRSRGVIDGVFTGLAASPGDIISLQRAYALIFYLVRNSYFWSVILILVITTCITCLCHSSSLRSNCLAAVASRRLRTTTSSATHCEPVMFVGRADGKRTHDRPHPAARTASVQSTAPNPGAVPRARRDRMTAAAGAATAARLVHRPSLPCHGYGTGASSCERAVAAALPLSVRPAGAACPALLLSAATMKAGAPAGRGGGSMPR